MATPSDVRRLVTRRLLTAREIRRSHGWVAVAENVLPAIGYHRVVIFEALFRPLAPVPPADVELDFAFVERDEEDELRAFRPDLSPTEIRNRFDSEQRCFVARCEGKIVSAYWFCTYGVTLRDVGYQLVTPPHAVYVFDAFTSPGVRGKRVAPALSRELKNRLAAEGFERWVAYVLGGNRSGLRNIEQSGSREVARVAALRFWKLPPVRVAYLPQHRR